MPKTKIEWCDYTVNPVKGLCPMACPYCYARRMYKRFKWDETIQFNPESMNDWTLNKIPDDSKIFIGSTMELFGDWVKPDWLEYIFDTVALFPKLTFIFLTKQPQNLIKWSPFPDNCWIGVSATNNEPAGYAYGLTQIIARVKFISFEPLLSPLMSPANFSNSLFNAGINWVIIGQQTPVKSSITPKIEWLKEIVEACDKIKIPVFLKNNLAPVFIDEPEWAWDEYSIDGEHFTHKLRQEFPIEE